MHVSVFTEETSKSTVFQRIDFLGAFILRVKTNYAREYTFIYTSTEPNKINH